MTPAQTQKLKEDLLAEKDKITEELKGIAIEDPLVKGGFGVKVDDMGDSEEDAQDEAGELDRNQAMVETLGRRLKEINSALLKLEKEEYGKCESCLKPIEPARLKVMPVASLCVSCAQRRVF